MRFAFQIAISHLRSKRQEAGVSGITLISMLGVTIGVAALVVVLSVMAGFEVDLREKILGSNAHVVVLSYAGATEDYEELAETISQMDGIEGVHPFTYSEMMIKSPYGASGVIFKGISPGRVGEVLDLVDNLEHGPAGEPATREEQQAILEALHAEDDDPGIIIGRELSEDLRVYVGDPVHIINPVGSTIGPMGIQVPDIARYRVRGIFYSGMYEYDTKWTYVDLRDAQKLLGLGDAATGVEITVSDVYDVEAVSERIDKALSYRYEVRHWKNLNRNLFDALKLEKVVMGLILSLIVAVASLNIAGTLILLVLTKGREIAILRAMGATRRQVRAVFILEGTIIGIVGASIGTVLGLAGALGLKRYGWPLDTDVYYLDSLPVVIDPAMVACVGLSALGICFVATLYPATRAADLDPVAGLRYE